MNPKEREVCLGLLKLFRFENKTADQIVTESQIQIFYELIFRKHKRLQILCATQYGKLVSDDTPVWTTKGWKNHGDLKIGDYVFNHFGKAVKVKGIAPKGIANREVIFTNGAKIKVHEKHEWFAQHRAWKDYRKIETKYIAEYEKSSFSIPNIVPLEGNDKGLLLDSYTLGVWLGDGISTKPAITIDPKDRNIVSAIPYKISTEHPHKDTGVVLYGFYKTVVFQSLRQLDLIGNKHIPDVYKLASIQSRLQLLAGLIDTDGSVNKQKREKGWRNGRVYFINTNKRLIDDVCDLIRSLGMKPSITKVKACISSSGIQGRKDTYYIGFKPILDIPTRVLRKKITIQPNKRRVRIREIREIEPVSGNCIQVDGGIYLVGEQMIPTHNSFIVALACVVITCIQKELVAVVAPTNEKARIIMRYYIEHLGDSPLFYSQLEKDTKLERLRMEESKERIILRNGGGIFVISVQAGNSKKGIEAAMGAGAKNVIQDESCLIPDPIEATVFRMIAGKGEEAFYCKIGNPFYRNHFLKSWRDETYHKILVDYKQGIKEGRYTEEFIDEAKMKPYFGVLFECNFPSADAIDASGYSILVDDDTLARKIKPKIKLFGELKMGCDVAGEGSNYSVITLRAKNGAKILYKEHNPDTMNFAGIIAALASESAPSKIYIDKVGIGKPVFDRLKEFEEIADRVVGVVAGEKADEDASYFNKRAEMFWRLREWLATSELEGNGWQDLLDVKYKIQSDRRVKIKGKDEMLKDGVLSPDVADALSLTFYNRETLGQPSVIVSIPNFRGYERR